MRTTQCTHGRRLAVAWLAGALLIGAAACSDDDSGGDEATATDASSTTEARETTASPEAEAEPEPEPEGGETTTVEDPTNDVIRTAMETDHPDEAALVDWSIFAWISGFGYTATIPAGSSAQATAVCDALSEVIDGHGGSDAIQVVAADAPDIALAGRPGPGGCAPA